MANKIRLRDNTKYSVAWCGAADGVLNVELTENISITDAAALFSDAAKTAAIAYLINGTETAVFEDYTTLLEVHRDRWNGRLLIQLEKAAVTDMIGEITFELIGYEPAEEGGE